MLAGSGTTVVKFLSLLIIKLPPAAMVLSHWNAHVVSAGPAEAISQRVVGLPSLRLVSVLA